MKRVLSVFILITVLGFCACTPDNEVTTMTPTAPTATSTATPAVEPTQNTVNSFVLPQTPATQLSSVYPLITIVYTDGARLYEQTAVQKLAAFLGTNATLATQAAQDGLVINVNSAYAYDGYCLEYSKGVITLQGSCAENTYIAVQTFINQALHNNPDVLTCIDENAHYLTQKHFARNDYVADIGLFEPVWQYDFTPYEWMLDFENKIKDFMKPDGRCMAFGHRGDIEHYPENSIEGIISAIKMGADAVEIDCYRSKDGVFVLNHGTDLAPTTDCLQKKGTTVNGMELPDSTNVGDWTYEQLQQLNLRYGNGNYSTKDSELTCYKIATLEEAMLVASEHCMLSLDGLKSGGLESPDWPEIFELIKKTECYRSCLYQNCALCQSDANKLRREVQKVSGVYGPTTFDRKGGYNHNTGSDWFAEFDFTTDEQFYAFYQGLNDQGYSFIQGNRLSKIIQWINTKENR